MWHKPRNLGGLAMKRLSVAILLAGACLASGPVNAWETQDLTYQLKLRIFNQFDTNAFMYSLSRYDYFYPLALAGQPNGYAGTSVSLGNHWATDGQTTILITPAPTFGSLSWLNRLTGMVISWDGHECRMEEPIESFGSICVFQPNIHNPYNDLEVLGILLSLDSEPGSYYARVIEI